MKKKYKLPRDFMQRAKVIVEIATGQPQNAIPAQEKNPHAVELGRLGGLKGGAARAKALTSKERSKIAKKAAKARWKNK